MKIVRSNQSGNTAAQARMTFLANAQALGINITSRTINLDLKVIDGGAKASTNL
ncbi:hypothetical protein [Populibacterium corticicola]|uniref:hypothetical protein n=1 Tax=Populibacterium corticicola TaxID=1812826 RepID=UPI00366C223A